MNTEQVKEKINYFKKAGTLFWSFNGGEPLLREDLGELARYCKPMRVSLMTNGTFPERIKYMDFDRVFVSIDGPKEIQDKIRGNGVFDKNIETLEILQRKGIPTVIVSVMSCYNEHHLEMMLELVKEYRTLWDIQPIMEHHGRINDTLSSGVPKHISWFKENKKYIFNSMDYLNYLENPRPLKCYAGKWFATMAPDGGVYPCVEFMGNNQFARNGMKDMPNMKNCKKCHFNCYAEYNLLLEKPWKLWRALKWR
jgi:MoaA/NifB/PqqE/SkfB family radical SAM enzyme